eukprot:5618735-Ditylum_brightwellii.AAC.1
MGVRGLDGRADDESASAPHARVSCFLRPLRARAAHPASLGSARGVFAGQWPNSNEHPSAFVSHD